MRDLTKMNKEELIQEIKNDNAKLSSAKFAVEEAKRVLAAAENNLDWEEKFYRESKGSLYNKDNTITTIDIFRIEAEGELERKLVKTATKIDNLIGNVINKMYEAERQGARRDLSHCGGLLHGCKICYRFEDGSLIAFKTDHEGNIYTQTQDFGS